MELLEQYKPIEDFALEQGAFNTKLIGVQEVVIDDRVRLKCQVPICSYFNQHLMCPPNTILVEKFRALCQQYKAALIVQVKSAGMTEEKLFEAEKKLHKVINKVEGKALASGNYLAAGFIASACKLCDQCVGYHTRMPCRHPYEARPSIEAMGVDIYKTTEKAGLGFALGLSEEMIYSGLILLA